MDTKLLLNLLTHNAKMEITDLASALNECEEDVTQTLKDLEKNKIICGYHTLINWDKTNTDHVMALIEVKVTPEREFGYDRIAKNIYRYPEVDTMYLMSGKTEFLVMVEGKTMQEVANFVGAKLAVVDGVTGTTTNFILKKYKSAGIILSEEETDIDDRMIISA